MTNLKRFQKRTGCIFVDMDKRVEFLYSGKFKKKMEKINKIEADFAIIVGEDEVKNNKLKIKNLKDGSTKDFNYENK